MDIKDIENKIMNIEAAPQEDNKSSISNFKAAKQEIKKVANNLKYQIGYDFPNILRILDKGGYTKIAEFRPNNVIYYYSKTFKKRLLNRIDNPALKSYLEGESSLE